MTIHLYGASFSTCVRRVALVAKELGVEYVLHPVNFAKGEHKDPAFLEHQPFGQVPYIVDDANDNFELYESRAIARYLVRQYGPQSGLIPTDPKKLAKFEQAASVEASNFDPHAGPVLFEKLIAPMHGLTSNEANLQKHLTVLYAKLDAYDVILGKSKYLAGDDITLADLAHLPHGYMLTTKAGYADTLINDKRPNVTRYEWCRVGIRIPYTIDISIFIFIDGGTISVLVLLGKQSRMVRKWLKE
ncbi:hypothetical protein QCA50_019798 [Cerrena zonata]|uniref:glutathione transferase n=1 Tax=Cerrena zonata TaxID=2478898 RepID=A0AAW0FD00_9APHY